MAHFCSSQSQMKIVLVYFSHHHNYLADEVSFHIVSTTTMFSEVDLSRSVMAEKGPLAELDTNVMSQGTSYLIGDKRGVPYLIGDKTAPSLMGDKGTPSLGKVALPDESLLPSKDLVTCESSTLNSGLGQCHAAAALNSFLPETVQLKREEDCDDTKEIETDDHKHKVFPEMDSDDEESPRESWKEKGEKPGIVRNLLGQKEKKVATDSYPRSTLKVLAALGLQPGCGDPLVAFNLLPGGPHAHLNGM